MKIAYVHHKFSAERLQLINHSNAVITQYARQGFALTLRQLYYQMVARDLFPESWADRYTGSKNNESSYKKMGDIISKGRRAGLIDWDAIVDRTRNLRGNSHWDDPTEILDSAIHSYAIDKWEGQDNRVEVWVEKDALVDVISRAASEYDVSYFACRGYPSDSEVHVAAMRCRRYAVHGQQLHILHLGDHDPSGLDMTRDLQDRFWLFRQEPTIHRLALNMEQVEIYSPPPNPAKETDSRFRAYQDEFGDESWELDALEPQVIIDLITDEIINLRDDEMFDERYSEQERGREFLREAKEKYSE